MNFIKRFGLIILINALVMVTISIILSVFNVQPYLNAYGINYASLMIYCLLWGFGGAFISLLLSKFMAKTMMGVQIIDPNTMSSPDEQWLVQTVHRLSQHASLPKMPEVGIYQGEDMNAFATGPSKSNSLVAVSSGILQRMNRSELEGVLAHEVAHIANGDMVTMVLIQGIVNAFGMFLSRIAAFALSQVVDEKKAPVVRFIATIIFDILFNFLGMFVVAYFSRRREFRADAGSASLNGKDKMIQALQRLQVEMLPPPTEKSPVATLQISDRRKSFMSALATHPPLEERIARLQTGV
ncbi:MAG: protease HtpX [Bdellovibrionaceae bacterium]|nr:protease HtpX [Pseudobdellovibrionaceae bacterium]